VALFGSVADAGISLTGYTDIAAMGLSFDDNNIKPGTDLVDSGLNKEQILKVLKGYVSYSTGLNATLHWADPDTVLFWDITLGTEYVNYKYTFYVAESDGNGAYSQYRDISHIMFQVTENPAFVFDNIINETMTFAYGNSLDAMTPYVLPKGADGADDKDNVDSTIVEKGTINAADPSELADYRWLKIEPELNALIWQVEFQSDRIPMWGNFYARDGQIGQNSVIMAYSQDLLNPAVKRVLIPVMDGKDYDPEDPFGFAPVPEPATLVIWSLFGAGLAGGSVIRKRKRTRWSAENRQAIQHVVGSDRV
jgi:hypothetical protein